MRPRARITSTPAFWSSAVARASLRCSATASRRATAAAYASRSSSSAAGRLVAPIARAEARRPWRSSAARSMALLGMHAK